MLDVCYSHLYFYQSLNRLQRGLSAIAELLVQVMADYWSNFPIDRGVPHFNAPAGGDPL